MSVLRAIPGFPRYSMARDGAVFGPSGRRLAVTRNTNGAARVVLMVPGHPTAQTSRDVAGLLEIVWGIERSHRHARRLSGRWMRLHAVDP